MKKYFKRLFSALVNKFDQEEFDNKEWFEKVNFCEPPNITYCKKAIYPDFDCSTCKWKTENLKNDNKD